MAPSNCSAAGYRFEPTLSLSAEYRACELCAVMRPYMSPPDLAAYPDLEMIVDADIGARVPVIAPRRHQSWKPSQRVGPMTAAHRISPRSTSHAIVRVWGRIRLLGLCNFYAESRSRCDRRVCQPCWGHELSYPASRQTIIRGFIRHHAAARNPINGEPYRREPDD